MNEAEKPSFSFSKFEKIFLVSWLVWLIAWLLEGPTHRHDFNTAQWMLHSWWFISEPIPGCLNISRISCWYYPTHPPLVHLFGIPGLLIFGWQVWPIRLVQALIVMWGALELRQFTSRYLDASSGSIAFVIFLASPMMILFGAIPNYEPTVTALICILMNRIHLQILEPNSKRLATIFVLVILGFLTDWSAYYPVGVALLLAWFAQFKGIEDGWLGKLRDYRIHMTILFIAACAVFFLHLFVIKMAYGSLDPLFSIAEKRSVSFDFSGTNWDSMFGDLPAVALIPLTAIGVLFIQLFTMISAWAIIISVRFKKARIKTERIGRWIILPLSAGIIHCIIFLQGALVHEYWTMPLLGPLCFIAASSCIEWDQKTKDRIIVACASIMMVWSLILLPLTDMGYSAGPIEEVDGIAEMIGDDSKLMISYELISGRPEVVLSLHTGDLTPTSLVTLDTELGEFDGAIACTDDSGWQEFFDDSQQINIIEFRYSEVCSSGQFGIFIFVN